MVFGLGCSTDSRESNQAMEFFMAAELSKELITLFPKSYFMEYIYRFMFSVRVSYLPS